MTLARGSAAVRLAAKRHGALDDRSRASARRALVWALILISVLIAYETIVTDTMHRQRQRRLASEFSAQATSPTIGQGHALAVLQIPKLGLNQVVARGDGNAVLRGGPGLASTSSVPGSGSNAVIVGKASRYGGSFSKLEQLQPDDRIFVRVKGGQTLEYAVRDVTVLPGADSSFGESSGERLTLVTSAGGWLSRDRRVVVALPVVDTGAAGSTNTVTLAEHIGLDDVTVILVWLSTAVLVVAFTRRVGNRVPRFALVVVSGPIVALAFLQLMLALERLLPATR